MKLFNFVAIFLLFTVVYSCDRRECKNTNPVFEKFNPEAKEYKTELVKQLITRQPSNVRYWIDNYIETKEGTYMSVFVQGDNLCAKGILNITNTPPGSGIKFYKQSKGGGYSGAELSGLTYRIDSSDGNYNLVFTNVERIID